MSHPNTLAARTRRSLMALAVAVVLLVVAVGREGGIYVMTAGGGGLTKLNAPESFSPSWGVVPAEAEKHGQALASK